MTEQELIKEINQLPVEQRQALLEASWQSLLDELTDSVLGGTKNRKQTNDIGTENFPNLSKYKAILRGLSPEDLKIFFLFVVDEMSVEQIAEVVGDKPDRLRYRLQALRAKIRFRARRYIEETGNRNSLDSIMREPEHNSEQLTQAMNSGQKTLSQRLYGILKFDGDPPNDEQVKDTISDYLSRKYS